MIELKRLFCSGVREKIIHFGEFVRWNRVREGKTTEALGREVGLTARRLIAIEAMATPDVQHTTMAALARAFGFDPEQFDTVWQETPVPITLRKSGPTTDEARRFAAACAAAGTTQVEGMRRLRSWIVDQDQQTQLAALSFIAPHRQPGGAADQAGSAGQTGGTFTHPLDHLQDPAAEVKKRTAQNASRSARSARQSELAAKDESTRH